MLSSLNGSSINASSVSAERSSRAVSAEIPDWSRESYPRFEWRPSQRLLRSLRDYATARTRGGPVNGLLAKVAVLRNRFWSAVTGADIPLGSEIGGGFMMPHPNGIVFIPT